MADIPAIYDFLQDRLKNPGPQSGGDIYEYRFLLSGCAFNGDLNGDYSKSTLGGLLLEEPFPLWKVGQSFEDYPQELAAWIKVAPVTYKSGIMTTVGSPHEAVADDLAALLTLFFRRLVTVIGPTSVTLPHPYNRPPVQSPLPQPLALAARETYAWPRLPLTVIYGAEAPHFRNPNPKEIDVSPIALRAFFVMLAKHRYGGQIIAGARLYHRALESLFKHTDVSYLLLVCAAEAVATAEMRYRTPAEIADLVTTKSVRTCAESLHLPADAVAALVAAATDNPMTKEKSKREMFTDFLLTRGADHAKQAPLFNPDILDIFKVQDEKAALREAYQARSGFVHAARPFRDSALVGTTGGISVFAMLEVMVGEPRKSAPSILWLERVVSTALLNFIAESAKL
ncbi:MAG TPA: hypothetical protein VG734_14500 [Lacunisphaera sp.]|nr:hypothetical protein [Lacunisphaera sp.]